MPALEKALITNTVTGAALRVQFSPEEYTVSRDVNYAQAPIPGLSGPLVQFAHGNLRTLDMELLLDTYEAHPGNAAGADVREKVRALTHLMEIDPTTHAPPVLLFTWASLTLTCLLTKVSERYIMFRADGAPVRARVNVTFQEFKNAELEAREVKRETADYTKRYVVRQGQDLPSVAAEVYEDPLLWRPIAIRNGIADPTAPEAGAALLIPSLPFVDPETGEVTP